MPASADAVLRQIARNLLPARADDPPPAWLRPGQVEAFRRAAAAVRRHGAALIAEPVGTGKSWVALAAALSADPRPPVILVPAVLVRQWREVLAGITVEARIWSHERISRGQLPDWEGGTVILDESHWFRNPATRRYQALAPWLLNRRGILVTATPVVNSAADLGHQLRLFLRDDALAAAGLRSLRGLRGDRPGHDALAEVIVAGWLDAGDRPALVRTAERWRCGRQMGQVLRAVDGLRLSGDPAVAALVRLALWGAAASSPAALHASLARYQALLDQAADARAAGRHLGREAVRRFIAADPGQLLLWELLPGTEGPPPDLALEDRAAVALLRARTEVLTRRTDTKASRLRQLVADERSTVVFTASVATVGYLCRVLGPAPVAWCTGAAAGIGTLRLPRDSVLAWFGPRGRAPTAPGVRTPRVLIATDVAAEGLDLQGAVRVVHYDLPWTAIRTSQRAGRIRRLDSAHPRVLEHWLLPPRAFARRLRVEAILSRKRQLPELLGVGEAVHAPWRERILVARALSGSPAIEGIAAVTVRPPASCDALACVRLELPGGHGASRLYVHDPTRGWRADDAAALELLRSAGGAEPADAPSAARIEQLLADLAIPVREAMREATGTAWAPGWQTTGSLVLLRRLRSWARSAARARDARLLARLDTAVRGLGRGQTAGEEALVARLAARHDASLLEHLRLLPAPGTTWAPPAVRLVGMVVTGP